MELERTCELFNSIATTNCDVCGSFVCAEHNREYGCDVCSGGERTFE